MRSAGGAGAGAVSRRNCSIAAAIAAASSGDALAWRTSMRGRGGLCLPLRLIGTAGYRRPRWLTSRYSTATRCSRRSPRPRRSSSCATASSATRAASGRCRRRSTSTLRRTATSGRCRPEAAAWRSSSGSPRFPTTARAGCPSWTARSSCRMPRAAPCARW